MQMVYIYESRYKCICCGNCGNNENLYYFPKSSKENWCNILGIPISSYNKNMRICKIHFPSEFFGVKNRLKTNAFPSINLPHNPDFPQSKNNFFNQKGCRRCCVPGCGITNLDKIKIFSISNSDPKRRKLWMDLTSNLENHNKHLFICMRHFENKYLTKCQLLRNDAVPTLFLNSVLPEFPNLNFDGYKKKCSIPSCNLTSELLFDFPKNEFRRNLWINLCGIGNKEQNLYACSDHFKKNCIFKKSLKPNALPTIFFLSSNNSEEFVRYEQSETGLSIESFEFEESFTKVPNLEKRMNVEETEERNELSLLDLNNMKTITQPKKRFYDSDSEIEGACSSCPKRTRILSKFMTENRKLGSENHRMKLKLAEINKEHESLKEVIEGLKETLEDSKKFIENLGK